IKSDYKFNIYIDLNIHKQEFLISYKIISLKKYNYTFKKWYNSFFKIYSCQFILIDKSKTMNYIKYQIYLQFSSYQKKLLPDSFEYLNPTSLQDHSKQSTKATLFYLYTCEFDTTQTCSLISANQKHDFSTISKIIFKNSYIHFPVTSKID